METSASGAGGSFRSISSSFFSGENAPLSVGPDIPSSSGRLVSNVALFQNPSSTILPLVLPVSIRRCASCRLEALTGLNTSIKVRRTRPSWISPDIQQDVGHSYASAKALTAINSHKTLSATGSGCPGVDRTGCTLPLRA